MDKDQGFRALAVFEILQSYLAQLNETCLHHSSSCSCTAPVKGRGTPVHQCRPPLYCKMCSRWWSTIESRTKAHDLPYTGLTGTQGTAASAQRGGSSMATSRIRIGIIGANGGTDRWGARAHIPAVMALPEAELVAVCTAREETARRAQERTGAPLAFWDYESMVRSPDIDLVTVAVRISLHHPIVMAALQAGKHVFCERPLALNPAQATQMCQLAQAQRVS